MGLKSRNIKLKMKIISPVHIGTGNDLEPYNYVIKDNCIYFFELHNFVEKLNDENKNKLIEIITLTEEQKKKIEEIENVKEEIKYKKQISASQLVNLRVFIKEIFNENDFKDIITHKYLINNNDIIRVYKEKLEKTDVNSENDSSIINQLLISEMIRDGEYKPYIPGSTLKGALRHILIKKYKFEDIESDIGINNPFKTISVSDTIDNDSLKEDIKYTKNFYIGTLNLNKSDTEYNSNVYMTEFIVPNDTELELDIKTSFFKNFRDKIKEDDEKGKIKENNKMKIYREIKNFFKDKQSVIDLLKYNDSKIDDVKKLFKSDHRFVVEVEKLRKEHGNRVAFMCIGKHVGYEIKEYSLPDKIKDSTKYKRYCVEKNFSVNDDINDKIIDPIGWIAVYY